MTDLPKGAFHDEFKIIAYGRELPFPCLRLLAMFACGWLAGIVMAYGWWQ